MTTLALWLLISGGNGRPASFIPFATQTSCEFALQILTKDDSRVNYHCVPSGATVEETDTSVKAYRE
jgi:hypothetical protein